MAESPPGYLYSSQVHAPDVGLEAVQVADILVDKCGGEARPPDLSHTDEKVFGRVH
jgi:hypothetical protein